MCGQALGRRLVSRSARRQRGAAPSRPRQQPRNPPLPAAHSRGATGSATGRPSSRRQSTRPEWIPLTPGRGVLGQLIASQAPSGENRPPIHPCFAHSASGMSRHDGDAPRGQRTSGSPPQQVSNAGQDCRTIAGVGRSSTGGQAKPVDRAPLAGQPERGATPSGGGPSPAVRRSGASSHSTRRRSDRPLVIGTNARGQGAAEYEWDGGIAARGSQQFAEVT